LFQAYKQFNKGATDAQVQQVVDEFLKKHDKNKDNNISREEFNTIFSGCAK